jgi:transposase
VVTPASVQDRHGALLLWRLRADCRGIRLAWADAGYAGKLTAWAARHLAPSHRGRPQARRPRFRGAARRRRVAERTFGWISKHRRCVRDYERLPEHHEAMVKWAMIALMGRRLARQASAAQLARAALAVTLAEAA